MIKDVIEVITIAHTQIVSPDVLGFSVVEEPASESASASSSPAPARMSSVLPLLPAAAPAQAVDLQLMYLRQMVKQSCQKLIEQMLVIPEWFM